MKNKRFRGMVAACLVSLTLYACNNEPVKGDNLQGQKMNDDDSIKILEAKWDTLYDHLVKEMKGATIADTLRHIALLNFSNEIQPDTFKLKVSPGPIASSKSELLIKTTDNRIIYHQNR